MKSASVFDAVMRFWWLVASLAVGGAIVGGLPAPQNAVDSITRWTASHTILVSSSATDGNLYTDPQAFNQLTLFATTGQVPTRAAEQLGYVGSPAALAAQVTVTADQQSGALQLSTTQTSAERAVSVADAFADELVSYLAERQDTLRQDRLASTLARLSALESQVTEAEAAVSVDRNDAVAQSQLDALSRQYSVVFEQYNVLQASQSSNGLVLTTLERAQPVAVTEQGLSAPKSRQVRGTLGALVGGSLGVGLSVFLLRRDRKIRTREQAEAVVGMTAHAMIPFVDGHAPVALSVVPERHDPLSDSYRTLRSIISFIHAGKSRAAGQGSITLVVSPGPGDGKTSVTANLAAAYVEAGNSTVAVNTDFRRPTLSRRLSVPHPEPVGLDLNEIAHAPLELLLSRANAVDLSVFDLAPMRQHNPGDLARVTARVLPRIAESYDSIVIDSSPVGATAEVLEFVPLADTIVIVLTLGYTSIDAARRTVDMIRTLSNGEVLMVLIGGDTDETSYYSYTSTLASKEAAPRFGRRKPKSMALAPPTVPADEPVPATSFPSQHPDS